jgi:two-component system, LytTR family, response regulator
MIKALLIDDEPLARSIIKEYLQAFPSITVIEECNNGFEGVKAINQHQPDLIFLDVQMPKINGFEMLELIDHKPAVIFTTAFDEYALKAFEAQAVDYLLKPFSQERFDTAMKKWIDKGTRHTEEKTMALSLQPLKQQEERNRVVVKSGNAIRIIPSTEIIYIEAYDDYVKIFTADDVYLKKKTMNYFEEVLDSKDFLRVHRSVIVRLDNILRIEPYEKTQHIALLKNGSKISLSRSGYSRLKEILGL